MFGGGAEDKLLVLGLVCQGLDAVDGGSSRDQGNDGCETPLEFGAQPTAPAAMQINIQRRGMGTTVIAPTHSELKIRGNIAGAGKQLKIN